MTDFPLCKAAGLLIYDRDKGPIPWEAGSFLVSAKDVEKFIEMLTKHSDSRVIADIDDKANGCICDEINARHCPIHQEGDEMFNFGDKVTINREPRSGSVPDDWLPPKEDLAKIKKLYEASMLKGDDPMPKTSDGFFKPEDFHNCHYKLLDGSSFSREINTSMCAHAANRLLQERGTVVYGDYYNFPSSNFQGNSWSTKDNQADAALQGLIINIQPIEKPDTAEGLLRDFCLVYDEQDRGHIPVKYLEVGRKLYERAKRLLEKK